MAGPPMPLNTRIPSSSQDEAAAHDIVYVARPIAALANHMDAIDNGAIGMGSAESTAAITTIRSGFPNNNPLRRDQYLYMVRQLCEWSTCNAMDPVARRAARISFADSFSNCQYNFTPTRL